MKVHLVIAPGVDVIAVYSDPAHAHAHALTVTGAVEVAMDVFDAYPTGVLDDIMSDGGFDDDQETPVEVPVPPSRTKPKTRP